MNDPAPDQHPGASERLLAMVAHTSMFTCLPLALVPWYASTHPFVVEHTRFAGRWYFTYVMLILMATISTVATVGVAIPSFGFALLVWIPAFVGLVYAALGWTPPWWLNDKALRGGKLRWRF